MARKVVLDTNVLISALGWVGQESKVLHFVLQGHLDLLISPDLIDELLRVTRYPKFRFSDSEIDGFLGRLLRYAHVIRPTDAVNAVEEDPDDNIVLACALAGKADWIVTGDAHLLKLRSYEGIPILKAGDVLRIVKENLSSP